MMTIISVPSILIFLLNLFSTYKVQDLKFLVSLWWLWLLTLINTVLLAIRNWSSITITWFPYATDHQLLLYGFKTWNLIRVNKSLLSFIINLQVSTKFHPTSQDIVCNTVSSQLCVDIGLWPQTENITIFPLDIGNQSTKNDHWTSNTSNVVTISFCTRCWRAQCASQ